MFKCFASTWQAGSETLLNNIPLPLRRPAAAPRHPSAPPAGGRKRRGATGCTGVTTDHQSWRTNDRVGVLVLPSPATSPGSVDPPSCSFLYFVDVLPDVDVAGERAAIPIMALRTGHGFALLDTSFLTCRKPSKADLNLSSCGGLCQQLKNMKLGMSHSCHKSTFFCGSRIEVVDDFLLGDLLVSLLKYSSGRIRVCACAWVCGFACGQTQRCVSPQVCSFEADSCFDAAFLVYAKGMDLVPTGI